MKQLLQSARTGEARVEELPAPGVRAGGVLVENRASLVSAGTERMVVEFSRRSLLGKARARPDLVSRVLEKARTEGVLTAIDAARARLDQPLALGYSAAGVVLEVGEGLDDLAVGDRVACAGGGHAVHAEILSVPRNLLARLPSGVSFETGAFTTVGAIGLHGFRLGELQLGESVVVLGLGLIGILTAQIARSAGCRVLGVDPDLGRVRLASGLGIESVVGGREGDQAVMEAVRSVSGGHGADAVLIAASTPDSEPVRLAGELCRDRGRVVAVGAVGLDVPRRTFYEKELDLRVSRSYGPGRYDPVYEIQGVDYPLGYVRWTEGRNLEAFLDLVARELVTVQPLVTHRFPIDEADRAYTLITEGEEPFLGVLITYAGSGTNRAEESRAVDPIAEPTRDVGTEERGPGPPTGRTGEEEERDENGPRGARHHDRDSGAWGAATVAEPGPGSLDARAHRIDLGPTGGEGIGVGLLGAGAFVTGTLLPAIAGVAGARMVGVCTASGASSAHAGRKYDFAFATTDESDIFSSDAIDAVVVATRHHLHPRQVAAALGAGKHVFCEKPPAIDARGLADVVRAASRAPDRVLAVGYNRRWAPMALELASALDDVREPLVITYRVNAGALPPDHWLNDLAVGGGRIVGEVCHFADFLVFLARSLPVRVQAGAPGSASARSHDEVVLTVDFANGSLGTVSYVSRGDRGMGKERCEVFGGGASAVLHDFRSLERYRGGRRSRTRSRMRQDKGHRGEWEAFLRAVRGEEAAPDLTELVAASLITFGAVESLRTGRSVEVDASGFVERALEEAEEA